MQMQGSEGPSPKHISSTTDVYILKVLSVKDKAYGFEILDKLNNHYRPGSKMKLGSIYPALNRLEKDGFVEWSWGDETEASGGARRKYYSITAQGLTTLEAHEKYQMSLATKPSTGLKPATV